VYFYGIFILILKVMSQTCFLQVPRRHQSIHLSLFLIFRYSRPYMTKTEQSPACSDAGTNLKVGAGNFFIVTLHFFGSVSTISLSRLVMVSTVWSVSCSLTCPPNAQPFLKAGLDARASLPAWTPPAVHVVVTRLERLGRSRTGTEISINNFLITTGKRDTESNPNPSHTSKQHAAISINIATWLIRYKRHSHETMFLHRF